MSTIASSDNMIRGTSYADGLRGFQEDLAKGIADGTIKMMRIDPVTHKAVEISAAAQTANQTGIPPATDATGINASLLKAAAQRRLGRLFG